MSDVCALIDKLNEFAKIYDILQDIYRTAAYTKIAREIEDHARTHTCTCAHVLQSVSASVGMRAKIEEFARTGKIAEFSALARDPRIVAFRKLTSIFGVGPAYARKWFEMGIKTLADVRRANRAGRIKLTHTQEIGLKYYADLHAPIPRGEVAAIGKYYEKLLIMADPLGKFAIAGSYRRGAAESGDVDIVFIGAPARVYAAVVAAPATVVIINHGEARITFLARIRARVRQVDIFIAESFGAALLYATGSWEFNEKMRARAKAMGFKLNQNGLYDENGRVLAREEVEIFSALGMPYVEPAGRGQGGCVPNVPSGGLQPSTLRRSASRNNVAPLTRCVYGN